MKKITNCIAVTLLLTLGASCSREETLIPDATDLSALENSVADDELLLDETAVLEVLGVNKAPSGSSELQATALKSGSSERSTMVYTMGNEVSGNEVIAFKSSNDGRLNAAGSYATGGTGTGAGLGNQGALALSAGGHLLFVVNPGSNQFSVFYVKRDGSLLLLDTIGSGGELPISITYRRGLIYVLNAGGTGNIAGFGFNRKGRIIALSGSNRPLSSDMAGPAQISFSPDGRALIVTEKATNTITSYAVNQYGRAGSPQFFPSAGQTPFGFSFGNDNIFYVSEAAGGAANASTVSAYYVNSSGAVSLVNGPFATNGSAACWVAATLSGKMLFATNTAGDDISSLSVSGRGHLELSNGGNTTQTGDAPLDAALDSRSRHLYVLASGDDTVVTYEVGKNGSLTEIDVDGGLPDRASGLAVR